MMFWSDVIVIFFIWKIKQAYTQDVFFYLTNKVRFSFYILDSWVN